MFKVELSEFNKNYFEKLNLQSYNLLKEQKNCQKATSNGVKQAITKRKEEVNVIILFEINKDGNNLETKIYIIYIYSESLVDNWKMDPLQQQSRRN